MCWRTCFRLESGKQAYPKKWILAWMAYSLVVTLGLPPDNPWIAVKIFWNLVYAFPFYQREWRIVFADHSADDVPELTLNGASSGL